MCLSWCDKALWCDEAFWCDEALLCDVSLVVWFMRLRYNTRGVFVSWKWSFSSQNLPVPFYQVKRIFLMLPGVSDICCWHPYCIGQSALSRWCGQYYTDCLRFPKMLFLVPMLGWVDLRKTTIFPNHPTAVLNGQPHRDTKDVCGSQCRHRAAPE